MTKEPESVQVIDRTAVLLDALADQRGGIGVRALAEKTGLSVTTTHRILGSLAEHGFVAKNPRTGNYEIGVGLIHLVSRHITSLELHTEARPYLGELAMSLNLTGHLGVLRGPNVLYVERLDVLPTVQLFSGVGMQVPAYCSSLGKCILSGMSSREVDVALHNSAFIRHTPNTIPDVAQLKEHLKLVRQRGWAMDDEEQELGFRCVGAPIHDYRDDIIAAVSVSGSVRVLTDDRVERIAEQVVESARQISQRLGAPL